MGNEIQYQTPLQCTVKVTVLKAPNCRRQTEDIENRLAHPSKRWQRKCISRQDVRRGENTAGVGVS